MADFRRKFSDAARRYIHLSYEPAIHPDERLQSLKCAMICAILSQAGGWWYPSLSLSLCMCVSMYIIEYQYLSLLRNILIFQLLEWCFHYYAGQQRSKQLATLFKDERCQQLPAFNILEKMLAKCYNSENFHKIWFVYYIYSGTWSVLSD